jgi:tRNA pseudouridine38-40 synthase
MERYKAILAYDGTAFSGFQAQTGFRTIEGEARSALKTLGWQGSTLLAGGRTDSGVHADGQVIAFDLEWRHSTEDLQRAFNALLPGDISCRALNPAAEDFHPRYGALRRCYRYRLILGQWPEPMRERYAWRIWPPPDAGLMEQGAADLLGKHDFRAFGSPPRKGSHAIRTVFRAEWLEEDDALDFWIEADAFLFRMVRIIVGTLLQLGNGRRGLKEYRTLLKEPPQGNPGPAAPARGLCLMRIDYPNGVGQG